MIARFSESRPDSSTVKSSDSGAAVRRRSRVAGSNTVMTVDLADIPVPPFLVMASLRSSSLGTSAGTTRMAHSGIEYSLRSPIDVGRSLRSLIKSD
jgi:hypothetical protein